MVGQDASCAALVYIGTISYMMYMIHIPVWTALYKVLCLVEGPGTMPGLLLGFFSFAVTIALAALSWRFFESPILLFKDAGFATSGKTQELEDELLRAESLTAPFEPRAQQAREEPAPEGPR